MVMLTSFRAQLNRPSTQFSESRKGHLSMPNDLNISLLSLSIGVR